MNIKKPGLLFILTGLLLGISWPHTGGLSFLLFFALIPALFGEYAIYKKRLRARRVLWQSYLGFLVFNLFTTWWIVNITVGGAIMAVVFNGFLMALFFWGFHLVHRRYGNYWGYTAFICIWMLFEYGHYNWELSWPWLNFGNAFANQTHWVQWYEYTGPGGGTLWILLANLCGFLLLKKMYNAKANVLPENKLHIAVWVGIIVLPIVISGVIYNKYAEKTNPIDVIVVQPNIDPNDKFNSIPPEEQITFILRETFMLYDSLVDFVVGPETALPFSIDENRLHQAGEIELLTNVFAKTKKASLVIGMSSHKYFNKGEKMPNNVRIDPNGGGYEFYNSALFLNSEQKSSIYHKVKLVLGVEKIPFVKWLPFLENFALEMGGTSGTLGYSANPWYCFHDKNNKARIAPSVCYESIYPEHMAKFITQDKANVIFVITNDGWWGDTPGYKQHLDFARLTAISLRRSIAQSANTGISAFIDQKGDVIAQTKWWTRCALRHKINLNNTVTFYAKTGDLLYRLCSLLGIGFLVLYVYAYLTGKNFIDTREV